MNNEQQDGRYAAPRAHVEDVIEPTGAFQLATRGSRFLAAIIDVVLILLLLWIVSIVTPWNPFIPSEGGIWLPRPGEAVAGFVLFMLLHGFFLATRGQTLGKMAMKIRIVRSDGSAATVGRVIGLRYGIGSVMSIIPLIGQIWGLLDSLFIFRESRQCLHDSIADTIVVKA